MSDESTDPIEKLLEDVHAIHQSLWADAASPASRKEVQQRLMLERMRALAVDLGQQGVTIAIMEGAFLMWWLKLACFNHQFAEGGLERCLSRIGPVMGPVGDILNGLGHDIQDEGPLPEMQLLGEKLEQVRGLIGGWSQSVPRSHEEEAAQTEAAHTCIRRTLVESIDAGVPPVTIESLLLYFWFRCTALRRGLKESFFQKLERHWELVMQRVNAYMDRLAAADRRPV
jgi:hypothetical protein